MKKDRTMPTSYNYEKFKEWLRLKKYSPKTIATTVRVMEYFRLWAMAQGMEDLTDICYQDAMLFMQWSSKQGASQKTVANYLLHVRKFYSFLISEKEVKDNPVAHIRVQGIKRGICYDIISAEDLGHLYHSYPVVIAYDPGKNVPPQAKNTISRKRNKVILGLLVYQGLRVEELAMLRVQDMSLREGKITIHGQRRTASRTLKLESHQVYELMDYLHDTRKELLQQEAPTDKLFVQRDQGTNFYGITQVILQHLRKINNRVKNFDQLRASVITGWLKQYDLRKVQYLAGHKYVSSTEGYKAALIDQLEDDIKRFHPL